MHDAIKAARERDPAARSNFEILLTYSGVHAIGWHRLAHSLYRTGLKTIARMVSQLSRFLSPTYGFLRGSYRCISRLLSRSYRLLSC